MMPTIEVRERKETDLTKQKGRTMTTQIRVLRKWLRAGRPAILDDDWGGGGE